MPCPDQRGSPAKTSCQCWQIIAVASLRVCASAPSLYKVACLVLDCLRLIQAPKSASVPVDIRSRHSDNLRCFVFLLKLLLLFLEVS